MSDIVPLSNLVASLNAAVSGGKSGAFFITTEQQHSAMVTLSQGAITGVKYRNTRGYDAATALSAVGQLKYQSAAEPTALPGETTLNTQAVLNILRDGEDDAPAKAAGAPASAIDLDAVRQRYIGAIGPIGGALFDEAMDDLADRVGTSEGTNELIERLAGEIDDEKEARAFRRDVGA